MICCSFGWISKCKIVQSTLCSCFLLFESFRHASLKLQCLDSLLFPAMTPSFLGMTAASGVCSWLNEDYILYMTSRDLPGSITGLPMGRQHMWRIWQFNSTHTGNSQCCVVNSIISKHYKMKKSGAFLEAKT